MILLALLKLVELLLRFLEVALLSVRGLFFIKVDVRTVFKGEYKDVYSSVGLRSEKSVGSSM